MSRPGKQGSWGKQHLLLALLGLLGGGGISLGLLLGEEDGVDVGQDTAGGDGDAAEELVELFVVADGELHVAGGDAGALVVAGGVAGELEDLSAQVLHDGGEVDGGATADAGGVAALAQVASHTADGELQASAGAAGLSFAGFAFATATFSFARHFLVVVLFVVITGEEELVPFSLTIRIWVRDV